MDNVFSLTIKAGNAAFEGANRYLEVARLLRETADKIQRGKAEGTLQDSNGNTVGRFEMK